MANNKPVKHITVSCSQQLEQYSQLTAHHMTHNTVNEKIFCPKQSGLKAASITSICTTSEFFIGLRH